MYIPLQCLTHGSPLISQTTPQNLAKFAKENGYPAIGLSDLHNLYGCVQYYNACKQEGLKPILGLQLEVYGGNEISFVNLYAKNLAGWKTLLYILYQANNPQTYKTHARLEVFTLLQLLTPDLVIIIKDKFVDLFEHHKNGHSVYLGLDPVSYPEKFEELRKSTLPKVAISPNHYLKREDWGLNKYIYANYLGGAIKTLKDPIFEQNTHYVLSEGELLERGCTQEEIDRSGEIFESIANFDILNKQELPRFNCPDNFSQDDYLRKLCRDGFKRLGLPKEKYVERIQHELGILSKAGMAGYFIFTQDIVNWARRQKILVGYGRGSGAGCLTSYLLGITNVDPIKYDLLFERFYSSERGGYPDSDLDFPAESRNNIVDYIGKTYGETNIAQICTFITLKGAASLKAVFRAVGVDPQEQTYITRKMPEENKIAPKLQTQKDEFGTKSTLFWCINNMKEFSQWCTPSYEGMYNEEFKAAIELDGVISGRSKHASAFALANEPIYNKAPLIWDNKNNRYIVGVNMDDAEKLGLIKLDLLSVSCLDKADFIRRGVKNGAF